MMAYTSRYESPLGGILLAADDEGLTGLWFDGQKYFAAALPPACEARETSVLVETACWLDGYFRGEKPDFLPPLHPQGTAFQQDVWDILLQIPYGCTMTYGEIARRLAQAVGRAVGHNKISIIIPCHRVVGTDGSLTGYAGGLERKTALLTLEHADLSGCYRPTKGTAL